MDSALGGSTKRLPELREATAIRNFSPGRSGQITGPTCRVTSLESAVFRITLLRGYAVENVAARICREAGSRVTTNAFVRDLDLNEPRGGDGRRLEIVVDGWPLFGGAQLAVDTTLVSTLLGDGSARRRAADEDEVALAAAWRAKETRYPELVGPVPQRGLSSWGWKSLGVGLTKPTDS